MFDGVEFLNLFCPGYNETRLDRGIMQSPDDLVISGVHCNLFKGQGHSDTMNFFFVQSIFNYITLILTCTSTHAILGSYLRWKCLEISLISFIIPVGGRRFYHLWQLSRWTRSDTRDAVSQGGGWCEDLT
jgi:hypothetical protein